MITGVNSCTSSAILGSPQSDDGRRSLLDARRIIGCLFTGIALLCLAPLMALIAVSVWLESGGPIFFSQTRLGKAGRPFRLHKFRKFHAREHKGGLAVTLKDDARFTRVGRVLESTKLDELPQLWNILVGEMALVGPRPESLAFADCFDAGYGRVLHYKPGIFGPCQVIFRHEGYLYERGCDAEEFYRRRLFPLKASIDLAYYPNRTTVSDMRWATQSVFAVFGRSSHSGYDTRHFDAVQIWVQDFARGAVRAHPTDTPVGNNPTWRRYLSSVSAMRMAKGKS